VVIISRKSKIPKVVIISRKSKIPKVVIISRKSKNVIPGTRRVHTLYGGWFGLAYGV
jgi:hypothetical protein